MTKTECKKTRTFDILDQLAVVIDVFVGERSPARRILIRNILPSIQCPCLKFQAVDNINRLANVKLSWGFIDRNLLDHQQQSNPRGVLSNVQTKMVHRTQLRSGHTKVVANDAPKLRSAACFDSGCRRMVVVIPSPFFHGLRQTLYCRVNLSFMETVNEDTYLQSWHPIKGDDGLSLTIGLSFWILFSATSEG